MTSPLRISHVETSPSLPSSKVFVLVGHRVSIPSMPLAKSAWHTKRPMKNHGVTDRCVRGWQLFRTNSTLTSLGKQHISSSTGENNPWSGSLRLVSIHSMETSGLLTFTLANLWLSQHKHYIPATSEPNDIYSLHCCNPFV